MRRAIANAGVSTVPLGQDLEASLRPQPTLATGTEVGRYLILHELGSGGMGVVYLAHDPSLNRHVALKLLRRRSDDPYEAAAAAARMTREAQAIAKLSHPNVVNVYDVGMHDGLVFITMEYVRGTTLTSWLREGTHSAPEIRAMFIEAGRGLEAAHQAGLVHRDFKPDNVLVGEDGRPRVLDFGLARVDPSHPSSQGGSDGLTGDPASISAAALSEVEAGGGGNPFDSDVLSTPLTRNDIIIGTPLFMAPEQQRGGEVDARSDQFSFCVALYRALYSQDPYRSSSPSERVKRIQHGTVELPPLDSRVPPWVDQVIFRGLEARPSKRWPSMTELLAALEAQPVALWRRASSVVAGAGLLAVATFFAGRSAASDDPACDDGSARVDSLWTGERQGRVRRAIEAGDEAYAEHAWSRVHAEVDDKTGRWKEVYQQTCEAHHLHREQSAELFDLRMQCLQERNDELDAVLHVIENGQADSSLHAVTAVNGLPSADRCIDDERLRSRSAPPIDPALAERAAAVQERVREVKALRSMSRLDEAEALASAALADSEDLGEALARLELRMELGRVFVAKADYEQGEREYREVVAAALRTGNDRLAVRAGNGLVSVVGDRQARFDEGRAWYDMANAVLDRMGGDPVLRSSLLNDMGSVWYRHQDVEEAIDAYTQAIAMRRAVAGDSVATLAGQRVNLGNALLSQGRPDEALASYQHSQAELVELLGEEHPRTALASLSVAIAKHELGLYGEALADLERVLPIFERTYGPDHHFVGATLSNLGNSARAVGRVEEAEASLHRAIEIFERALGPTHPDLAITLNQLGEFERDQGRHEQAAVIFDRVTSIWNEQSGEDSESALQSRMVRADLERRRGHAAEAAVTLEQLHTSARDLGLPLALRGEIGFTLARARHDAGAPRDEVQRLLVRARVELVEGGPRGKISLRELETWRAEHVPPSRSAPL
ncbi:MAG: serine/threonine-protein kinase [Myxococcota bacterium]